MRLKIVPRFKQFAVVAERPDGVEVLALRTSVADALTLAQHIKDEARAVGLGVSLDR